MFVTGQHEDLLCVSPLVWQSSLRLCVRLTHTKSSCVPLGPQFSRHWDPVCGSGVHSAQPKLWYADNPWTNFFYLLHCATASCPGSQWHPAVRAVGRQHSGYTVTAPGNRGMLHYIRLVH